MNRYLWLVAGSLALGGAGCVVRAQPTPVVVTPEPEAPPPDYGPTYPTVPPPAPIVEYQPPPPGYGYIWVEGYHRWDGRAYVWVPGRWDRGPQARAVWVPGRWVQDKHGWYYVQGHWR